METQMSFDDVVNDSNLSLDLVDDVFADPDEFKQFLDDLAVRRMSQEGCQHSLDKPPFSSKSSSEQLADVADFYMSTSHTTSKSVCIPPSTSPLSTSVPRVFVTEEEQSNPIEVKLPSRMASFDQDASMADVEIIGESVASPPLQTEITNDDYRGNQEEFQRFISDSSLFIDSDLQPPSMRRAYSNPDIPSLYRNDAEGTGGNNRILTANFVPSGGSQHHGRLRHTLKRSLSTSQLPDSVVSSGNSSVRTSRGASPDSLSMSLTVQAPMRRTKSTSDADSVIYDDIHKLGNQLKDHHLQTRGRPRSMSPNVSRQSPLHGTGPRGRSISPHSHRARSASPSMHGGHRKHRSPSPSVRQRRNLPAQCVEVLESWLDTHLHRPYPTTQEQEYLAEQTHLKASQVYYWFVNQRRRHLIKPEIEGGPWRRKDSHRRPVEPQQQAVRIQNPDTISALQQELLQAQQLKALQTQTNMIHYQQQYGQFSHSSSPFTSQAPQLPISSTSSSQFDFDSNFNPQQLDDDAMLMITEQDMSLLSQTSSSPSYGNDLLIQQYQQQYYQDHGIPEHYQSSQQQQQPFHTTSSSSDNFLI